MSITVTTNAEGAVTDADETAEVTPVKAEESKESASTPKEQDETKEVSETSDDGDKDEAELEAKDGEDKAEDEGDKEETQPKRKSGVEKRIDKLTKQRETERLEKEYWKAQALAAKNPESNQEAKPKESPIEATGSEPDPDKFDTHADYVKALAKHYAKQMFDVEKVQAKETALKSEFEKQRDSYFEQAKAFEKERPDFSEVIDSVDHIPLSATVQASILKHGPKLAYELAKDPEALAEICNLPALDAAERIGEIRARMIPGKTEAKPKTTKAPRPLKPIGTSQASSGKKSLYDPNLSQAEFERLREEKLAQRA